MRSDVASCQRWDLNKIAVEPQASPGVYWSSPAQGHEVWLSVLVLVLVSVSVQALYSCFHHLLFLIFFDKQVSKFE